MKKSLYFLLLILPVFVLNAQKTEKIVSSGHYDSLKAAGKLDPAIKYVGNPVQTPSMKIVSPTPTPDSAGACSCMKPLDASYSVAPFQFGTPPDYRNDDGSTGTISIPFSFCFYGTNYSSFYINNNGNISFLSSSGVFSSTGFPNNQDIMIAPFWADVDTRDPSSGLVHYKVTPTYAIIKWEAVGYYNQHVDKLCTFQLIISDGSDPILPSGKNIAFCYGDMDWTTGDASSGVNGFGGIAATVGVNKGDGVNFIQIGRFDQAGTAYIGPYANNGVDWLDNKSFYFDGCGSATNLPPLSTTNSACGDTMTICGLSDTLVLSSIFLAPENTQNVTISASAPTLGSNFTILNNTTGVTGQIDFMVVGSPGLAGYHTVTITATDNGTPALSTTVSYVIYIVNNPIPDPVISISPTPPCASANPTLTLSNCSSYDTYVWSNGNTSCSFSTTTPGQYFVTVSDSGCYKTSFANAEIYPAPNPSIVGTLSYCNSSGTTVSVIADTADAGPYQNFSWSNGQTNDTIFNVLAGTYTVTVTDTIGCTGSTVFTVTSANPSVNITATPANICPGDTTTLTASIPGGTYTWSPNLGSGQSVQATTSGVYSVTVLINGCTAQTSFTLNVAPTPSVTVAGDTMICQGASTTITASGAPGTYTYQWSTGSTAASATFNTAGSYSVIGTSNTTSCKDTTYFNIVVTPNPTVTLSAQNNNVICQGSSNTITSTVNGGTPAFTYAWTSGAGSNSTAVVSTPGAYSVLVTDANNCTDTASINLSLSAPSVSMYATDSTLCNGECAGLIALSAPAPLSYSWLPATIGSSNDSVTICQPGIYNVIGTDAFGCTDTASIIIAANPTPVAAFEFIPPGPAEPGDIIYYSDSSDVTPGYITSWEWNFGDGDTSSLQNPLHAYSGAGTFPVTLIVTSEQGCKDTVIKFYSVDPVIYAPNIITPNNDGKNDLLYFKGLEFYPNNTLTIFNRWGEKIYEESSYKNNWNGGGQNDGTYFYILEVPNAKPQSVFSSYFMISR